MSKTGIRLDKIEAAKRQIDTAVWLWFNGGDIVSIHSLTGTAFGIIYDLFHARWKRRPLPFSRPPKGIAQRDWVNLLKETETFGKHARNDADKEHDYSPQFTMKYVYYAIVSLIALTGGDYDAQGLRSIFIKFFHLANPTFRSPLSKVSDEGFDFVDAEILSRAKFFEKFGGDFRGNPPRPDLP